MLHWLSQIDQFGTMYTPRIQKQKAKYQSKLGGIASLIVYSTSLCYCIYKFYMWSTHQLPPFLTNQSQTELLLDEGLNEEAVQFSVTSSSGMNPFDKTNMILIPIIQEYIGYKLIQNTAVTKFHNFTDVGWGGYLSNLTLSKNASIDGVSNTTAFVLSPCSAALLKGLNLENITCASTEIQTTFLESYNIFHMDILIQQFNPQIGQLSASRNSFFFLLDPSAPVYTQVLFQQTTAHQDTGLVLQNIEEFPFVSSYSLITQSLNPTFASKVYGLQIVTGLLLRLDSISNKLTITNPKLGNVLADIGSIFEVLLILRIFVMFANERFMLDDFYNKIIGFYYPEYKQVKIEYTFFGKVRAISINNKQVHDFQKMYRYIQSLKEEAKMKLTAMNTIYELSRLQFIVNSIQNRETLMLSHQVGIRLRYQEYMRDPVELQFSPQNSNHSIKFDEKLIDDDFNLLGIEQINKVNNEIPFRGANFYIQNQVTVQ